MTGNLEMSQVRWLVLIPTTMERDVILSHWNPSQSEVAVRVCGFGVVASSVSAMHLIERCRPDRVILAGIGGLFPGQAYQLGEAIGFDAVAMDGVGVGQGSGFLSPTQLGWDDPSLGCCPDRILLQRQFVEAEDAGRVVRSPDRENNFLLTVCSASADSKEADWRAERFPGVVAEDMEGYPVALACQTLETPLSIVRGFSNFVGERDKAAWKIRESLQSVAIALKQAVNQAMESGQ